MVKLLNTAFGVATLKANCCHADHHGMLADIGTHLDVMKRTFGAVRRFGDGHGNLGGIKHDVQLELGFGRQRLLRLPLHSLARPFNLSRCLRCHNGQVCGLQRSVYVQILSHMVRSTTCGMRSCALTFKVGS